MMSAVAFAGMHALIRYIAATGLHAFEIAFFRVFFAFIALSPIFFRQDLSRSGPTASSWPSGAASMPWPCSASSTASPRRSSPPRRR